MQDIEPIYKWIVDTTIAKARASFLQDGVDECVATRATRAGEASATFW
jgi:hypothetical protein